MSVCKKGRHYFHHLRRFLSVPMTEVTGVCALMFLFICSFYKCASLCKSGKRPAAEGEDLGWMQA